MNQNPSSDVANSNYHNNNNHTHSNHNNNNNNNQSNNNNHRLTLTSDKPKAKKKPKKGGATFKQDVAALLSFEFNPDRKGGITGLGSKGG